MATKRIYGELTVEYSNRLAIALIKDYEQKNNRIPSPVSVLVDLFKKV